MQFGHVYAPENARCRQSAQYLSFSRGPWNGL
jgi:hypothetical protein